uniref:Uncharacterized protein n=1 Tax=Vitrella brassicaformis TaxID=1169539 RepID=A0A7S1PE88_9ALVE|mmetsp:Transcript_8446/g.20709  ORF Transcript_8446/g.20709 Transcript_8446/m.20709 type:complete len:404 (+) Transcript_8446:42-1253(+)
MMASAGRGDVPTRTAVSFKLTSARTSASRRPNDASEWPFDGGQDDTRMRKPDRKPPSQPQAAAAAMDLVRAPARLLKDQETLGAQLREQGNIFAANDDFLSALLSWEKAITISPRAALYEQCAQALLRLDEPFRAIKAAKRAIVMDAQWQPGYLTLGRALLDFGEVDSAVSALEKCVGMEPDDDEAAEELERAFRIRDQARTTNDRGRGVMVNNRQFGHLPFWETAQPVDHSFDTDIVRHAPRLTRLGILSTTATSQPSSSSPQPLPPSGHHTSADNRGEPSSRRQTNVETNEVQPSAGPEHTDWFGDTMKGGEPEKRREAFAWGLGGEEDERQQAAWRHRGKAKGKGGKKASRLSDEAYEEMERIGRQQDEYDRLERWDEDDEDMERERDPPTMMSEDEADS